ncbi:MAG: DHA2 family efflux MFS transporter permease subunit [Candidatus Tectomicrobia bacterium]|uniref:DHA2 family efflux MFS transporter permease subunit n=1 Tax=Tectimicrobiota bacterium TaxID=2528274 RepID=A0A937VZT7_UNCTE|nr:DHA2 family efflux MFS transporter permease subunit [Candidatus Tectomicrobia bacterium]
MASSPRQALTATTPRAPTIAQARTPSAPWAISLSIILGCLTHSVMMGSINIAVPTMMTSLRADVAQIQWVLTAFMIARTVVMPTLGWLGGWLGNRRLYLISLCTYLVSSMLCGLSWNLETMICFRVLQGMSAGYLTPLGMAILHETYPQGKRGMAMGMFMAGMSFGPALGPSLGGYLVEHLSWRAVFYINLPIGLIALAGSVLVTLPEGERRQSKELDLLGLMTMTTFVVTLLLAVSQARTYGWGSTYILMLLLIAGSSLLAFVVAELTCEAPMVSLQVFGNAQFVLGALANFFESFTNFSMMFLTALFLQQGLGFTASYAGEIMLPAACIWGLTSLYTGRLSDRVEGRWLIVLGSLSQALVLSLFLTVTPWSSAWTIAGLLMLRSLTRGFIQSPIMAVTMATLPAHQVRLGVGLRGLLNSLGGTFGIAFAGIVLQDRLAVRTLGLTENQALDSPEHQQLVELTRLQLLQAGEEPSQVSIQIAAQLSRWLGQEASSLAYQDMFLLTSAVVLLTAIPVLWLRQQRSR